MNSYDLSRRFINFSFENPTKIKPNHYALYFFAVEHCNRLGWKENFGLPTTMAMEAIGIRSYNTYINTFNELVEFKFFNCIEKSKNQYSSNIIALSKFDKAHDKALDKALIKHTTKQSESTHQSISSIIKQITNNKYTSKQVLELKTFLNDFLKDESKDINKAFETEQQFLNFFNNGRGLLLGKKGKTKIMGSTDSNNFKKLNVIYTAEEFKHAITMMSKDEWVKKASKFTISHLLAPVNFDKYLNKTDTLPMAQGLREGN